MTTERFERPIIMRRPESFLWPPPLDWNKGSGRAAQPRPDALDIILPVYGAHAALERCLSSVGSNTELQRHRLVIVVDGPQSAEVERVLQTFRQANPCTLLRNDRRRGFVASVNFGMRESTRDVILLNSDTVVTERWVEKMLDAAYSHPDVATVTPLSNNATLCSVPQPFEENLLPSSMSAAEFGALIERVSAREYPRLPTGVGFCLLIRRAALDDVGFFDEQHFGLGYGEENDFCMRALRRGWLHIADDATFIEHAGNASFGAERAQRIAAAGRTMRRKHRRYRPTIAAWMKDDPMKGVRQRITAALTGISARARNERSLRIVHVVHGWPPFQFAGTELYAAWLARQQRARHHVSAYVRGDDPTRDERAALEWCDEGIRVRIVNNRFTARNPLRRNAIYDASLDRDFKRFLRQAQPDLVHIHHLAGHAFSLTAVVERLRLPLVVQVQDWWSVCARVNLVNREGRRCIGPSIERCNSCATLTKVPPTSLTNRLLHHVRRRAALRSLERADAWIVGSKAIRDDYFAFLPLHRRERMHVLPYGVDIVHAQSRRGTPSTPLRFGYVGSIQPHKGLHTLAAAMRHVSPSAAELHLWGNERANREYANELRRLAGPAALIFEGSFDESEKPRVYASMDVMVMPSIGLESFGLAPREAMASGIPVVASAGGALSEMFDDDDRCGAFFPAEDVEALRRIIERLIDDPSVIAQWSARLPQPESTTSHALAVEKVYEEVLAR